MLGQAPSANSRMERIAELVRSAESEIRAGVTNMELNGYRGGWLGGSHFEAARSNYQAALTQLDELKKLRAGQATTNMEATVFGRLGWLYYKTAPSPTPEKSAAQTMIERAIQLSPTNAALHCKLGIIQLQSPRNDFANSDSVKLQAAVASLQRCLDLDAKYRFADYYLSQAYATQRTNANAAHRHIVRFVQSTNDLDLELLLYDQASAGQLIFHHAERLAGRSPEKAQ